MKFPVSRGLFRAPTEFVHAVDGISFDIAPGESLGLVGESGCGKSTTGRMLVKLLEPTGGSVLFTDGDYHRDVAHVKGRGVKEFRRRVQMIFQDPYESMNPRRTIFDTVSEPLAVQKVGSIPERENRVLELLRLVGLTPPDNFLFRYPHELSGGQRQRVAIARALVMNPSFIVADEPTSMLDVSIRISIMELMAGLAREFRVSYLYITHDLAVARYMCDRIAVMYLGKVAEQGTATEMFDDPRHPYTEALLAANPDINAKVSEMKGLRGAVPDPANPPEGCRFHTRCPVATPICGWEVDDAVAWLGTHEALLAGLTDVQRRSNFDATLSFQDDSAAAAVGNAVQNGDMPPSMKNAMEGFSTDGSKVTLTFKPVDEVELEDVGGGHMTACVLHTSRHDRV
jgi:peptide/nickel transport system ATP-binding protein